jgi:WD40 repeat protein
MAHYNSKPGVRSYLIWLLAWALITPFTNARAQNRPPAVRSDVNGDPMPAGAIARLGTLRYRSFGRNKVALSPDGKRVACGGHESIRIFEIPSGKVIRDIPNLGDPNQKARYSEQQKFCIDFLHYRKNGQLCAVASNNEVVIVYEPEAGREITKLTFDGRVNAISRDNRLLASVNSNGLGLVVFDLPTRKRIYEVASDNFIFHASFSPDGTSLATCEFDEKSDLIRFWNAATGKELSRIVLADARAYEVLFSPDGKRLIALIGSAAASIADDIESDINIESRLVEFDVNSGKKTRKLGPKGIKLSGLAISNDGKTLAGLCASTVRFFDLQTGILSEPPTGHEAAIKALAFTPDGQTVVSAGDNSLRRWNPKSGQQREVRKQEKGIGSIALSEKADMAAFENSSGKIQIWYLPGDRLIRTFTDPAAKSNGRVDLNLFGDADILTVLGKYIDDTCRFWNVHSGAKQTKWIVDRPDVRQISAVAISKLDGKVALAFADTVVLLDFVSGKELWSERAGDGEYISRLKFSPDGRSLLSGDKSEGTIRLWDFESGKKTNWAVTPPGHRVVTNCVFAIAPDGKTIATGGQDGVVRLWDMATARERRSFAGHQGWITCLQYSPDGKTLASGSEDTTVLIWDLASHSP